MPPPKVSDLPTVGGRVPALIFEVSRAGVARRALLGLLGPTLLGLPAATGLFGEVSIVWTNL